MSERSLTISCPVCAGRGSHPVPGQDVIVATCNPCNGLGRQTVTVYQDERGEPAAIAPQGFSELVDTGGATPI